METGIIVGFIVTLNVLLLAEAYPLDKKIARNDSVDSYESHKTRPINFHRTGSKLSLAVRPEKKMSLMSSRNEIEAFDVDSITRDNDPVEVGNKKILKFGKRIIESISRHGLHGKVARVSKSGNYHVDWWKKNRRLEKIRKRLAIELARQPELKNHLRSLGWRNASEMSVPRYDKVYYDKTIATNEPTRWDNDLRNAMFYEILTMSPESSSNGVSTNERETGTKEQTVIFVYMPITVGSSTSEIDRIDETPDSDVLDSPTKFSLNVFDDNGFDAMVPNVEVVDVASSETSTTRRNDESFTTSDSGGQTIDNDRLLQLIPLIVEELRSGLVSEDERRKFGWIFGKRLWPLLEREASKRPDETMDRDLAMFLLKGELSGDRDSAKEHKKRQRQRRQILLRPIASVDTKKTERDYDYDFDDDKTQDTSFVELIELAARHESKKFEEETKKRAEKEMHKKKWMNDYYEDYSYEDDDTY